MLDTFNPFGKTIDNLESSDLLKLKEVHEGWYIEYKEQIISSKNYAKSISAMANTYGGWIFVGIQEDSKHNNVAGEFPGISSKDIEKVCQQIRQGVAEHLNPNPHFEVQQVSAPEGISGEQVICIFVPPSSRAPIIHSDGRLYRRVGDSSEPKYENNRDAIEHLLQRNQKLIQRYENWFDQDPELSQAEDNSPYLRIMMLPDYWNEKDLWYEGDSDDFTKVLQTKSSGTYFSTNFENLYSRSIGFIARSSQPADFRRMSHTFIFKRNLKNEILIPISSFPLNDYASYIHKNSELDSSIEFLLERVNPETRILDLSQIVGSIESFFRIQRLFESGLGHSGDTLVKFKLGNVWRNIPLISATPESLQWDKYGIPLLLNEQIASPRSGQESSFEPLNLHTRYSNEGSDLLSSIRFLVHLFVSLGLGVGKTESFHEIITAATMASVTFAQQNSGN